MLHRRLILAGLMVVGPVLVASCGRSPMDTQTSGAVPGISKPELCSKTFCTDDAGRTCRSILHVLAGATPGGDGSRGAPFGRLASAAALARAGDCIALAAGRYASVVLPGGVSLLGRGADHVVIEGQVGVEGHSPSAPALKVEGGGGGLLQGLSVAGPGRGLTLTLTRQVTVRQVRIAGVREVGLELHRCDEVELDHVELLGTRRLAGVHGVGLLVKESRRVTLEGGLVQTSGSQGVLVHGASASLQLIRSTIEDSGEEGLVVQAGATVGLAQSHVLRSGSTGVAVDRSTITLRDCRVEASQGPGVLLRHQSRGELRDVIIEESRGVGLAIFGSRGVRITGGRVSRTRSNTWIDGSGTITLGDGVEVLASDEVQISDLLVEQSARVDLLIDGSVRVSVRGCHLTGPRPLVVQNGALDSVLLSGNLGADSTAVEPVVPATPWKMPRGW